MSNNSIQLSSHLNTCSNSSIQINLYFITLVGSAQYVLTLYLLNSIWNETNKPPGTLVVGELGLKGKKIQLEEIQEWGVARATVGNNLLIILVTMYF